MIEPDRFTQTAEQLPPPAAEQIGESMPALELPERHVRAVGLLEGNVELTDDDTEPETEELAELFAQSDEDNAEEVEEGPFVRSGRSPTPKSPLLGAHRLLKDSGKKSGTARSLGARPSVKVKSPQKMQRELEDLQLVLKSRGGSDEAMDQLIRRYESFIRLKASSYFLAGGESQDLIQEGMVGLYKAVRDFRPDKETSFRSFAELCVTRQLITAIKTATRFKHAPLNTYVSFAHTPSGQEGDGDITLGDALPGPSVNDPSIKVISTEELSALVRYLGTQLSGLEADALRLYLEGCSYEEMAEELGSDTKVIDNALQRVKRKILSHQAARLVLN